MKTIKTILLAVFALVYTIGIQAQTADEIIARYIDAIGGKAQISQISSLYMEGTMDVMGNQGSIKTTLLTGKGYKQEIDVMGSIITMCFNQTEGWQINPMGGSAAAEVMPAAQYNAGKSQMKVAGTFLDYAANGYTVELAGQEAVGEINANKIKITGPDNTSTYFYFDPATGYLIKSLQQGEMMGQMMEVSTLMSNYQKTEQGFAVPYRVETNYGGQIALVATFTKVEVNKPIDEAVFAKP
jgi:hypothetical protein